MSRMQAAAPRQPAQAESKQIDPDAALLDEVLAQTVNSIDKAATRFTREIADPGIGQLLRASKKAAAIQRLRQMLTGDTLALAKSLMNSPMGFLTDRDPKRAKQGQSIEPYGDDVIRDCLIEALLNGVLWDGNEFNIITGKTYITQAGYWRKVCEIDGITDIDVVPGVPLLHNGGMVCRVRATWKIGGIASSLTGADGQDGRVFPIKNDSGSTPDNMTGKALRKAYKAIYEKATGSVLSAPDGDIDEASKPAANGASTGMLPTTGTRLTPAASQQPAVDQTLPTAPAITYISVEQVAEFKMQMQRIGLDPEKYLRQIEAPSFDKIETSHATQLLQELRELESKAPEKMEEKPKLADGATTSAISSALFDLGRAGKPSRDALGTKLGRTIRKWEELTQGEAEAYLAELGAEVAAKKPKDRDPGEEG